MGNPCRHYLGLYPDNRPSCKKGRNVRKWAIRRNGNSSKGIALRLPCSAQRSEDEKPLFDCPDLNRKTDEEIAISRADFSKYVDKVIGGLTKLQPLKQKMIDKKLSIAKATCVWCGSKDKLILNCAINYNNHLHVKCEECQEGFIE